MGTRQRKWCTSLYCTCAQAAQYQSDASVRAGREGTSLDPGMSAPLSASPPTAGSAPTRSNQPLFPSVHSAIAWKLRGKPGRLADPRALEDRASGKSLARPSLPLPVPQMPRESSISLLSIGRSAVPQPSASSASDRRAGQGWRRLPLGLEAVRHLDTAGPDDDAMPRGLRRV